MSNILAARRRKGSRTRAKRGSLSTISEGRRGRAAGMTSPSEVVPGWLTSALSYLPFLAVLEEPARDGETVLSRSSQRRDS